jgi:hypothetical protein
VCSLCLVLPIIKNNLNAREGVGRGERGEGERKEERKGRIGKIEKRRGRSEARGEG